MVLVAIVAAGSVAVEVAVVAQMRPTFYVMDS